MRKSQNYEVIYSLLRYIKSWKWHYVYLCSPCTTAKDAQFTFIILVRLILYSPPNSRHLFYFSISRIGEKKAKIVGHDIKNIYAIYIYGRKEFC